MWQDTRASNVGTEAIVSAWFSTRRCWNKPPLSLRSPLYTPGTSSAKGKCSLNPLASDQHTQVVGRERCGVRTLSRAQCRLNCWLDPACNCDEGDVNGLYSWSGLPHITNISEAIRLNLNRQCAQAVYSAEGAERPAHQIHQGCLRPTTHQYPQQ